MAKYNIEIKETLSRVVEIAAPSLKKAKEKAEKLYKDSDLILDYNDLLSTEYLEYPPRRLKGNFDMTLEYDDKRKALLIDDNYRCFKEFHVEDVEQFQESLNQYISKYASVETLKELKEKHKNLER